MVAPHNGLILLLPAPGGPALSGGTFRLGIPHQAYVDNPPPVVHPPGDPRPDLLCPTDTQRPRNNEVGEDKGSLRVPTPT